jgi:hypothetical protein
VSERFFGRIFCSAKNRNKVLKQHHVSSILYKQKHYTQAGEETGHEIPIFPVLLPGWQGVFTESEMQNYGNNCRTALCSDPNGKFHPLVLFS